MSWDTDDEAVTQPLYCESRERSTYHSSPPDARQVEPQLDIPKQSYPLRDETKATIELCQIEKIEQIDQCLRSKSKLLLLFCSKLRSPESPKYLALPALSLTEDLGLEKLVSIRTFKLR